MIDDEADFENILDASEEVQTAAKFRPKQQVKPRKAALPSKSAAPDPTAKIKDGKVGDVNSSEELISQGTASLTCPGSDIVGEVAGSLGIIDSPSENILESLNNCGVASDSHEIVQTSDSEAVLATDHSTVDSLANLDSVLEESVQEETPSNFHPKVRPRPDKDSSGVAETTYNVASQSNVGRENGKGESVSFVLPDDSEGVSPTDINSEMSNFSYSCNDTSTDEKLKNSPWQTAEKQHTDKESQSHEREPSDHAVEQQPKSDVGETGLSMELRRRKKLQKVGIAEHIADDYFNDDNVELSAAEQDNGSGDDYTAGGKRKVRRKSRAGINKEPPRDSMCIEETQQQKVKSKVSSRGRKRTLNDEATENLRRSPTEFVRRELKKFRHYSKHLIQ